MRVCIDIQSTIARRAGVARYTQSLVQHLGAFRGSDDIDLFYFDFKRSGMPFAAAGTRQHAVRWLPGRIVQAAWKRLAYPPFDLFSGTANVFHFPNFVRPPLRRGRSVVTIHDATFLRYPETTEAKNLCYLQGQLAQTVAQADAIVTNSTFTASEIGHFFPAAQGKLHPIPLGLSEHVTPPTDETVQAFVAQSGLRQPYILHVGTLEPRKNIPFLIQVFEQLRHFDGDLVLAGMRGWAYEPILAAMEQSSCASRIRYIDYVDENDLPALYAGATLFAFPSLYEGFGFPPLEAMACGVPVIAAATGSLPEILGHAARMVQDFDVPTWADAMDDLLSDQQCRKEQIDQGSAHATSYTWSETARQTWDVYRSLA